MNLDCITKESLCGGEYKPEDKRLINLAQDLIRFRTNFTLDGLAEGHGYTLEEVEQVYAKIKEII